MQNLGNGDLFDQADEKKMNSSQLNDNYDCVDEDKVLGTELLASQKNYISQNQIEENIVKLLPARKVFTELVFRELRSKWPNMVISISTVVLLLFFLALINVAMGVSPLIYLMISEREHTETDVIFYNPEISFLSQADAYEQVSQFLIDYKTIKEKYCDSYLQGCVSRFSSKAQLTIDSVEYQTNYMFTDISGEQHANLGRRITLDPLSANGECYVSEEIYKLLSKEQKKKNKTDGRYELILEITLELLLAQIPGLQNEQAWKSRELKEKFIANQLFKYFNSQGFDYSTANELLAEILSRSELPESITTLLIHSFSLDNFLHTQSVNGESKQVQQYNICLSISSFILQIKADLNLLAIKSIPQGSGKFADSMSRIVVMDYITQREWLLEQISSAVIADILEKMKEDSLSLYFSLSLQKKQLSQRLFDALNKFASKQFFEENAMELLGIFKDKANIYMSEASIIKEVKVAGDGYSDTFGVIFPTRIAFPLAIAQTNKLRQKVILDSSYNAGVFLLVALSSVIIYSVSEASISQQIQEYGIVRIVGSSVKSLLLYTLIKTTIFYILPSLILSSMLNQFVLQLLNSYFYNLLQLKQSSHFDASASFLLTTLFIAIILPLICNLMPFKTFLDKQVLSQALHAHSRVLNQTKVFVQKLEKYGISPYALLNSVILVSIGILAYYFAPYAFITKNMSLFLLIVNITFLMVNAGISLLMALIQRWIEKGFIKILLKTICFKDCNLSAAILNNFKNNKTRMKKVGMIIMMIFSFYISIGSNVNSQVQTIKNIAKLNIGSDYVLSTTAGSQFLDEIPLINQLEKYKELHPGVIKSYSFVSMKLSNMYYFNRLSSIKSYTSQIGDMDCVAVDPQLYDSIYNELFIADSVQFQGQNPSNSLYSANKTSIGQFNEQETFPNKDSNHVLSDFHSTQFISYYDLALQPKDQKIQIYISTKEKKNMQLDYGNSMNLQLGFTRFRGTPAGFASKLPGFASFTQNELLSLMGSQPIVLVSLEQFHHILRTNYLFFGFSEFSVDQVLQMYTNSTNNIPKTKLFVKLTDDFKVTNSQRNQLKGILLQENESSGKTTYREKPQIELQDTYMIFASLQYLIKFWDIVFHLISVFIFILSYYLLTITFKSNVQENMHNIKIYKALGIDHSQIQRIFIYEGLSVMLVNGLLGVLIGLLLSVMIQQQVVIFLEIAQDLSTIPYEITLILLAMCVFLSIFISKREVDQIKDYAISEIGQ